MSPWCRRVLLCASCVLFLLHKQVSTAVVTELNGDSSSSHKRHVRCLESGRFYRDPGGQRTTRHYASASTTYDDMVEEENEDVLWTHDACSRYYLCLEGEVFAFQCSGRLVFDVERQLCDEAASVENCDLVTDNADSDEVHPSSSSDQRDEGEKQHDPKPNTNRPTNRNHCQQDQLSCQDNTCIPASYFCDGSLDCPDGSDEDQCRTGYDAHAAKSCDPTACQLPHCFCSRDGTRIPGDLDPRLVPQMVTITFDDAITDDNYHLYVDGILDGRTSSSGEQQQQQQHPRSNPHGCPLSATFFVTHQQNSYQRTQQLWNGQHEIAVHSISHRAEPEDWWSQNATVEDWFDEMIGQANILNRYARVRMADIRGLRVPYLQLGWNRQFIMMKEFGFGYDSSMVAPFTEIPYWPYTLDYRLPHHCKEANQNCPTRSYPGIWEMVINQLVGKDYTCATLDACPSSLTGEEVYRLLHYNFKRHYHTNRAPFGLLVNSKWLKRDEYLDAFQRFLDDLLDYPDVYFLNNWQVIEWMREPRTVSQVGKFPPWQCTKKFTADELACETANVCRLRIAGDAIYQQTEKDEVRTLTTCSQCPKHYPWLRNEFGV